MVPVKAVHAVNGKGVVDASHPVRKAYSYGELGRCACNKFRL